MGFEILDSTRLLVNETRSTTTSFTRSKTQSLKTLGWTLLIKITDADDENISGDDVDGGGGGDDGDILVTVVVPDQDTPGELSSGVGSIHHRGILSSLVTPGPSTPLHWSEDKRSGSTNPVPNTFYSCP